jgi:hypothetical protein
MNARIGGTRQSAAYRFLPASVSLLPGISTMRARNECARRRRSALAAVGLLFWVGCDAVREDRTINISPSGNQVAFQHGADGIFIADPRTGELHRVFDPDRSIVAVSSPLWSADESRAIFTTARDAPPTGSEAALEKKVGRPPGSSAGNPSGNPTATPNGRESAAAPVDWNDAPEGRFFLPLPVVYTCWQIERAPDGSFKKPVALFEAHAGHAGYVAGNWAVRQSPKGERILFVDQEAPQGHAVWSFDIKSAKKSRVFPPAGIAAPGYVLADFTPDGSRIACTAGRDMGGLAVTVGPHREMDFDVEDSATTHQLDGIWIQAADGASWRHVAQSSVGANPQRGEGLGTLIERRPVFSKDGSRFAFARPVEGPASPRTLLFRAQTSDRKVEQIFAVDGQILDSHWSPDARLGFVAMTQHPELTVIDAAGKIEHPVPHDFVRNFAGWNPSGDTLAYVIAEHPPRDLFAAVRPKSGPAAQPAKKVEKADKDEKLINGSPLLWPDPLARDALVVLPKGGQPRVVIAGLRFTFPQWSPARESISVWGTFTPSHQSWVDAVLGHGLTMRTGDPAAVIDVTTGSVHWLAIKGDEQTQIGHYLQEKHDFAGALDWYRKAEKTLPKLQPLTPLELEQGVASDVARRRMFEFLLWHCLAKLGKETDANARLTAFEQACRIRWPTAPTAPAPAAPGNGGPLATTGVNGPHLTQSTAGEPAERVASLMRALAEAQALLSIDDTDGAINFFRARLDATTVKKPLDPTDRFGDLVALSQLELLAGRPAAYLQLATNELGPWMAANLEDRPQSSTTNGPDELRLVLTNGVGLALSPLFDSAFTRQLPADAVAQAAASWRVLRSRCNSQSAKLLADLVLRGLLPVERNQDRDELNARIAKNPAHAWYNWDARTLP